MTPRKCRRFVAWCVAPALLLSGAEHNGVVKLGGLPISGATVIVERNGSRSETLTDAKGSYLFPDLRQGVWTVKVEMLGFAPVDRQVTVPGAAAEWSLTILPLVKIVNSGIDPVLESLNSSYSEGRRCEAEIREAAGFLASTIRPVRTAEPNEPR